MLLGIAAFLGSVITYMPARFAAEQIGLPSDKVQVSGTIWNGYSRLGDAHVLTWQTSGWESLRRMAVVVNWHLTGPQTDLMGRVAVPLPPEPNRAELDAVRGSIGWPLVELALPDLPIRCDATAVFDGLQIKLIPGVRQGDGIISTSPGRCERLDADMPAVPTPALSAAISFDSDGLVAVLVQTDLPQTALATLRLSNADRIIVTIHPAGAALVPGMPSSADSEIELPLATLFP
ncbi:hypothetical protein [Cypionkella psychrotolerans]|uniref:hypothetical protein n=1 Tax=Cypionkella psychrotolerans TaxID=1678131 RepID=UPI0012E19F29|nr:hypothetical protein [Cypionkella psychrotolerans]